MQIPRRMAARDDNEKIFDALRRRPDKSDPSTALRTSRVLQRQSQNPHPSPKTLRMGHPQEQSQKRQQRASSHACGWLAPHSKL